MTDATADGALIKSVMSDDDEAAHELQVVVC